MAGTDDSTKRNPLSGKALTVTSTKLLTDGPEPEVDDAEAVLVMRHVDVRNFELNVRIALQVPSPVAFEKRGGE